MNSKSADEVLAKRMSLLTKWKLRCPPVAKSLEEAGERLFTFVAYPPEQWRSLRTTNAIERVHEEFKRRIKTQCLLPCAETAAMLLWALLALGQITLRRVNGWATLDHPPPHLHSPPDPDHHAWSRRHQFPPAARHDLVHVMRIPRGKIELKLLAGRRERLIHSSCRRHEPPGAGSATKDGESRHELLGLREHRTHELAGCR
jgi:hypothetical protein